MYIRTAADVWVCQPRLIHAIILPLLISTDSDTYSSPNTTLTRYVAAGPPAALRRDSRINPLSLEMTRVIGPTLAENAH